MPELVTPAFDAATFFAGCQPTLRGDGLVLRPWHERDWPLLLRAYEDPGVRHWHGRTLDEAEARGWAELRARQWRTHEAVDWAIVGGDAAASAGRTATGSADAGAVLGRLGIRRFELDQALGEVAYWVLPEARGARVATRALLVLCDWAFGVTGMHRLELVHSVANAASCRVAERAGFVQEGVKRRELLHADGWHDTHLHARLADDPGPPV